MSLSFLLLHTVIIPADKYRVEMQNIEILPERFKAAWKFNLHSLFIGYGLLRKVNGGAEITRLFLPEKYVSLSHVQFFIQIEK